MTTPPRELAEWLWHIFRVHGVPFLLVLVVSWILLFCTRLVGKKIVDHVRRTNPDELGEAVRRAETLALMMSYTTRVFVICIIGFSILHETGTDLTPLLTGAGLIGVVVGFGAQSLVKDLLTGVFIFTENQFSIGDMVELGGKTGTVEAINLRTTMLRSSDGSVHIVPNGQITVTTNMSYRWSRSLVDVQLGYDADYERAVAVLKKVCAEAKTDPVLGKDFLEEPRVQGPESFGEHSLKMTVNSKVVPLRQWDVGRELRRRIMAAFDKEGIRIAIPQRMISVKSGELVKPAS